MTAHVTEPHLVDPDNITVRTPSGRDMHSRYIYNFRDDTEAEECTCSDAASWPAPKVQHALDERHDLAVELAGLRIQDRA